MSFVQNFPFFSIVLCMFAGIISSVLNGKWAKRLCVLVISAVMVMSVSLLIFCVATDSGFVYMMGHFPAPWGNEIRAGVLEAAMAMFFSIIMFLCVVGGVRHTEKDVEPKKLNLFYLLIDLLLSSLLALVYTNDIFTAYVFVEINTLAACGLIIIRQKGHAIVAGIRYMVMSLLGSGLLLIGISLMYDVTGHLLMSDMHDAMLQIMAQQAYSVPVTVIIGLVCVGLAIKSALFPFHSWVPDTYGYSTCTSASILSSLVSKGYIFLLIKIMYRVIGIDIVRSSRVLDILFVFGVIGMVAGSIGAIREKDLRRMIAYSSVAQIGYIYMGIGIGTNAGMVAAIFHIVVHGATKSLLFISGAGLTEVSGGSKAFRDLTGAGYRHKTAGIAFAVGCLSMVGIPMFAGFISKVLFASAAVEAHSKVWVTLIALAVSTVLNAMYFLRTLLRIYTKSDEHLEDVGKGDKSLRYVLVLSALLVLNVFIGLQSQPIIDIIQRGLEMFS